MNLILLGPPGAGKGTLANLLKESLGIPHISTGDILRDEMNNSTSLGRKVKQYIEGGKLVPDDIVTALIEQTFSNGRLVDRGYMLDGFPRTEAQAERLDKILAGTNRTLDYAVYLKSSLPVIIKRLTGRRVCRHCGALFHTTNKPPIIEGACDECGGEVYQRADDNEQTIKTRLDVYLKNTKPIVEYYQAQGKLHTVDADKDAEVVKEILIRLFHEDRKPD